MLHQVVNSTDIYQLIWHHIPEKWNLYQYCCVCPNSHTEKSSFVETYSCELLMSKFQNLIFYNLLVTWCTSRFNIQEFYFLPTLYFCVLYLSESIQRLVPHVT
jgi:hypothetical protein